MSLQHRERPGVALQREEGMDATAIVLLLGPSLIVGWMNDAAKRVVNADWTGIPYAECVTDPAGRTALHLAKTVIASGKECLARSTSEFRHIVVEVSAVPLYEGGLIAGVGLAIAPLADQRQRAPRRAPGASRPARRPAGWRGS